MNLVLDLSESLHGDKCDTLVKQILFDTLREYPETTRMLEFYGNLSPERVTNQQVLTELSWVIYSSGFRYDIVKAYWPAIAKAFEQFDVMKVAGMAEDLEVQAKDVCRRSGFRNLRKAIWCIKNAQRILELDFEKGPVGGLRGYLSQLAKKNHRELVESAPDLVRELGFVGIGNTTIFHLMKNLGFDIFKPDIHVRRVLSGLKLIAGENSPVSEISEAMLQLSSASGMRVSELDTLLFIYGRVTGDLARQIAGTH